MTNQDLSVDLTEGYFHLDSVKITTLNPIKPWLASFLLSDNLNQIHRHYLSHHLHSSRKGFISDLHVILKISVSFINVWKSKQLILKWNSAVLPVSSYAMRSWIIRLLSSTTTTPRPSWKTTMRLSFYPSFCQSTLCLSLVHVSLIIIIISSLIISAHLCFTLVKGDEMAAFWSRRAAGGCSCYTFHFTFTQLRIGESGRPGECNNKAYSDKQWWGNTEWSSLIPVTNHISFARRERQRARDRIPCPPDLDRWWLVKQEDIW